MATPDVKVRISGEDEGVTQLLKALQKALRDVDKEQEKTGQGARNAAAGARASADSFSALERTLQGIAGALTAQKLLSLASDAAATGNEIGKLAQKTGAGAEALSVLTVAAEESELSQQDLARGLTFLQKALVELQKGTGPAVAGFRALGLSAKDLEGLTVDQAFRRVADAMAHFQDGAGKTDAALKLFGRSGAELLPVLDSIAGDGFDQLTAQARRAGRVLSEEDVRAAQAFDDALDQMTQTAKGVAQVLVNDVLPSLTTVATFATDVLGDAPDSVKAFGAAFVVTTGLLAGAGLAVRALIAALGDLVIAEAAAGAAFAINPIGAAVVAIGLLTAAYVAYTGAVEHAQAAEAGRIQQTTETASRARVLIAQYETESRVLASTSATAKEKRAADEQLKTIKAELIKLGPEYEHALAGEEKGLRDVLAALREVQATKLHSLDVNEFITANDVELAKQRLAAAQRAVETLQQAVAKGTPLPPAAQALLGGAVSGQGTALAGAQRELAAAKQALDASTAAHDAAQNALARAQGAAVGTPLPTKPTIGTPTNDGGLAQARLAAARAALQRELGVQQDGLKAEEQANQLSFEVGLRSLSDYFARRLDLTRQGTATEIAALEQERQRLAAAPLATAANPDATPQQIAAAEVERKMQLADLTARIAAKQAEGQRAVNALLADELKARDDLANRVLADEAKVREAKGQTFQTTLDRIQREADAFRLALSQQGVGAAEREIRVKVFVDTLTAQAQLQELQRQATLALNADAPSREKIEEKVAAHVLSQADGEARIAALERARKPQLEAIVAQMRVLAQTLGPEAVQSVEQFAAQVDHLGTAQNAFGSDIRQALTGDLATFLGSTIDQVNGLGDAFRSLALSAVQSIQQIVGQLLALEIVSKISHALGIGDPTGGQQVGQAAVKLGAAGAVVGTSAIGMDGAAGALSVSGGILLGAAGALEAAAAALAAANLTGGALGFATGGYISGPGTTTSDSIVARLSDGEFVMRAAAVDRYGVDFFAALNGMRTPRLRSFAPRVPGFAQGGLVSAGGAGGGTLDGRLDVTLDEGLLARRFDAFLQSTDGERRVLRHVVNNRRALGLPG